MVRAEPRSAVSVEILMEQEEVAPVRVGLKFLQTAEDRAAAVGAPQEDASQAGRELGGDFPQRLVLSRAGGAFHLQVTAVVVMKFLQRLDQQEIHREPDQPPPDGVAD